MIEIRELTELTLDDLHRVANGYISNHKYAVIHSESGETITFELHLEPLKEPYVKKYSYDNETMAAYKPLLSNGFSFAVFDNGTLVGLAVSEVHQWNNSLWVHEFHIAESHRGKGLGRQLMARVTGAASSAGLRIVVCETQNLNVPVIMVYHKLGFHIEGVDLSYYRNSGSPDGEIALFLKKRLISRLVTQILHLPHLRPVTLKTVINSVFL
jgi:ribosomal protein S18 acetylase RimI-like enzyme